MSHYFYELCSDIKKQFWKSWTCKNSMINNVSKFYSTTSKTTEKSTTAKPTTTSAAPEPTTKPVDPSGRTGSKFDGWSFFGGILLTVGVSAIGFISFKYYKVRSGGQGGANYNRF